MRCYPVIEFVYSFEISDAMLPTYE